MQSEVSEISPILVEVKIEVPWDTVEKDLENGFTRVSKVAKVKGFRPGKVPRDVVKKLYRREVEGDVSQRIVERTLIEAVEKHEISIAARPEIEAPEITVGEPLTFTARIEVRPKLDSVTIDGFKIHKDLDAVTDEAVNEDIDAMRERVAELREPSDKRPAKANDVLTIDYVVEVDGVVEEGMSATDRKAELGNKRLLPEIEAALVGASVGDVRKAEITFGDDHPREAMRGKKGIFSITVKALEEKILPELDDEFAKARGAESVAKLRADTRDRLEKSATQRSETSIKDQIVDALVDANDIPVPPTMLMEQKRQMLQEVIQFMQMMGPQAGNIGEMIEGIEGRAERRVKAALLLGAVARLNDVKADENDVSAKLADLAAQSGKHIAKLRVEYQGEKLEMLESQILEEKLVAFLRSKVELVDGPRPEKVVAPKEAAKD